MSVINKMLRDLDQRQAATPGQALGRPSSRDQLMRGTQALALPAGHAPRRPWLVAALVAGAVLAGLLAWWQMASRSGSAADLSRDKPAAPVVAALALPPMSAPSVLAPSAAATLAASLPSPVLVARPTLASPGMSAAGPSPIKSAASGEQVKPASPVTTSASVKPMPVPAKLLVGPTLQAASAMPQAAVSNVTPPVAPLIGAGATSTAVQAKPAMDTVPQGSQQVLAQAQALWNEGARASAIDLLRQALSRVEAASQGSAPGVAAAALAALVRELVRMELADAQVSNALKDLIRLEPQIGQVADLWAMRGNAAQRLGQHAEAVSSYQRALAITADEPRWLLGLAVSLAAQGETTQAADLAEKVRVMGALRPEIAKYLRQLGVVIRLD